MGVVKRQEKELNNFYEDDEDFEEDGLEVLEQGKYFLLGNVLPFSLTHWFFVNFEIVKPNYCVKVWCN